MASPRDQWDLVVVGGGAGGLSAARAAARDGARVALINAGPLGGDCTFTGCVPSKTVIAGAKQGLDFGAAFDRAREVVASIAATETGEVLGREGVDVIDGWAVFESPTQLHVKLSGSAESERHRSDRIVLAMGARPAMPPIDGIDTVPSLTTDTLFELERHPGSMVVLGGGPIGCELSQALARLGVSVTLIEMGDRLLSREEPAASAVVEAALRADGVDVRVSTTVRAVRPSSSSGVAVETDQGTFEGAQLFVATGRQPRSAGMGLEHTAVEIDRRGHVVVDDALETAEPGIFAVGDITGRLPFTHVADAMGRIAATNALRSGRARRATFSPDAIPWVTFTDPEVARVGALESEAAGAGVRVAMLPNSENDRARAEGVEDGFISIIAGRRRVLRNLGGGRVLGATIVGPRAGELIHEPALAMATNMFVGRLAQTVHAYPTWSSGIQKAAAQFFIEIEGRSARPARRA